VIEDAERHNEEAGEEGAVLRLPQLALCSYPALRERAQPFAQIEMH
jgi:hypothetical protein